MYVPKYTITTAILQSIGAVEAAKEVIANAPLVPAWEAKFQGEARLRAAHYGTVLEGNDLTLSQAKVIVEEDVQTPAQAQAAGVVARERDVQEVINYRNVLDFLEQVKQEGENRFVYSLELLLKIHRLVVSRIVPVGQEGKLRETQVVLRNSLTGEIGFRPPGWLEVPFLLDEFLAWLNSEKGRAEHPVLRAGITHYILAAVHPFVEGNGRVARATATLVLFQEGYDIRRLFALEEYFDHHAQEYFGSLMQVSNQSHDLAARDLTPWLETFTEALAIELTRIKDRVRQLSVDSKIKQRVGQQVSLTERQLRLVEYLNSQPELTTATARTILPMVSEDTILRDLHYLLDKEVIAKLGSTKSARYTLKK